jgi:carboxylate-amine ligase
MQSFLARFRFDPSLHGYFGVEREFFLCDPATNMPVSRASVFLDGINDSAWTYELSLCQVEHRTTPATAKDAILAHLRGGTDAGRRRAVTIDCELRALEVAPETMPLDVYPDARYFALRETLPPDVLRAACRVAGTHIHIGVRSIAEAIAVSNALRPHIDWLANLGDHSAGERRRLYSKMSKTWEPPQYESPEHFFAVARARDFADNPRNCYDAIRISTHGTVEVRAFGMTDNAEETLAWVEAIRTLIRGI